MKEADEYAAKMLETLAPDHPLRDDLGQAYAAAFRAGYELAVKRLEAEVDQPDGPPPGPAWPPRPQVAIIGPYEFGHKIGLPGYRARVYRCGAEPEYQASVEVRDDTDVTGWRQVAIVGDVGSLEAAIDAGRRAAQKHAAG